MSFEPAPMVKKRVDFALVKNEDLRPWTTNPELDKQIHHEMDALERTITYIAPQMNAGNLGNSVLDGNVPGVEDFQNTIKSTVSQRKSILKLDPMNEFFPLYVAKSRLNMRNCNAPSRNSSKAASKPSTNTSNFTQEFHLDEQQPQTSPSITMNLSFDRLSSEELYRSYGLDSRDIAHIGSLQQSIFEEYKRERRNRPPTSGIKAVQCRCANIPAVLPVSRSKYNQLLLMQQKGSQLQHTSSLPSIITGNNNSSNSSDSNGSNTSQRRISKHHSAGSLSPQRLQALVTRSGSFR